VSVRRRGRTDSEDMVCDCDSDYVTPLSQSVVDLLNEWRQLAAEHK
jgi:hypothetical protein